MKFVNDSLIVYVEKLESERLGIYKEKRLFAVASARMAFNLSLEI
jgi:hypothetical protein